MEPEIPYQGDMRIIAFVTELVFRLTHYTQEPHMLPLSNLLAALCLLVTFPLTASAFDMHFLDQAPMRFFTNEDMNLFQTTVDQALDDTPTGDSRQWTNDATGSAGEIRVVNDFTEKDLSCRRLAITNRTKQTQGRSVVEMCKVDGVWKVLRMP